MDQCAFEDNVATNSGGGLSQAGGSGNVTNCIFINNQARPQPPGAEETHIDLSVCT